MKLRFIGIDPNTGTGESPTVWVDESSDDLVIQVWKPTPELAAPSAPRSKRRGTRRESPITRQLSVSRPAWCRS